MANQIQTFDKAPQRVTRTYVDGLSNREKYGRQPHLGMTIKWLETLGGFQQAIENQNEPASVANQILAPDEIERQALAGEIDIDAIMSGEGDRKRYRPWRVLRIEKLRSGQASITPLESEHLHYHLALATSAQAAGLFSPKEVATLSPTALSDRILAAGFNLSHPFEDPLVQLRLLADLCEKPHLSMEIVPAKLRLSDQGDGRERDLTPADPLPRLAARQEYVLDVRWTTEPPAQSLVFEFAAQELERKKTETQENPDSEEADGLTQALLMPYRQATPRGFVVTNKQGDYLKAGSGSGQFGFGSISLMPTMQETLDELLGPIASKPRWSRTDLRQLAEILRPMILRGTPKLAISLIDYELVGAL